jgi:hypothetical protein
MSAYPHREALNATAVLRKIAFVFPLPIPKTAEQTPQAGLSYVLLQLV